VKFSALFVGVLAVAIGATGCGGDKKNKKGGENTAPVASAGDPQSVKLFTSVSLDGSASADADEDDILTYAWTLLSVPAGSTATLSDVAAQVPTFEADREGTYVAGLVVSDGKLASPLALTEVYVDLRVAVFGDYHSPILSQAMTYSRIPAQEFADIDSEWLSISETHAVWYDERSGENWIFSSDLTTGEQTLLATVTEVASFYLCGSRVVWSAYESQDTDVFFADLTTGEVTRITSDDSVYDDSVSCGGDLAVWSADGVLMAYDMGTGLTETVAPTPDNLFPLTDGTYIAWSRFGNGLDIYAIEFGQGVEFPVVTAAGQQYLAGISGGVVAWEGPEGGTADPWIMDLDGGSAVALVTGSGSQHSLSLDGDILVFADNRNGNGDIRGVRISTLEQLVIDTSGSYSYSPRVSGDWVTYHDDRNYGTSQMDVYLYRISTGSTTRVTSGAQDEGYPVVNANGLVAWHDYGAEGTDFYQSADAGLTPPTLLSAGKPRLDATNIGDYNAVLFGDDLEYETALEAFELADEAGVPMLSIGTYANDTPLAQVLADDSRYGLYTDYTTGCDAMHVVTSTAEHAVFAGLGDPGETLWLNSSYYDGDEQFFQFDSLATDAPADVRVLARLGENMCYAGEPAIVEFTTANGTRVILDGSANTYDGHDFWTLERWRLLENEMRYLAENPTAN
jgi:hypothetical protein